MFATEPKPLVIRKPSAILFDMNRTVTTRNFVSSIFDRYVMANITEFIDQEWINIEIRDLIDELRKEAEVDAQYGAPGIIAFTGLHSETPNVSNMINSTSMYVIWATVEKKDNPPLRQLRNRCLLDGYQDGIIKTWVYKDAVDKLKKWKSASIKQYILAEYPKYMSKLMLETTIHGNLDLFIEGYFDGAEVGSPSVPSTYQKLLRQQIAFPKDQVLLVSHCIHNVRAARQAGIGAILVASHLEDYQALSAEDRKNFPVIRGLHELEFADSGPTAITLKGDVNERFAVNEALLRRSQQ